MAIEFKILITDEAVLYARTVGLNPGWHLTPKKWSISSTLGEISEHRTTDSMFTPWYQSPFSGIYTSGTNRLQHSVVIPPNASTRPQSISEMYFIYEDYYGNEFLFAIAWPVNGNGTPEPISFTPGVSQTYSFTFALNNTTLAEDTIINLDYTYPQDIEDHNLRVDAHDYLLARDGSRTATGILKYETPLNFTDPRQIVDKEYTDKVTDKIQNSIDVEYCPVGSMMWWPKTTPPKGWLIRDGSAVSRTTHKALFNVIGTTFGSGNGSTTFNLPDDRGRFIRGFLSGTTASFGQIQNGGLPNITGSFYAVSGWGCGADGSFYIDGQSGRCANRNPATGYRVRLNASRSNSLYGSANEVRPINRNYLPIIKG